MTFSHYTFAGTKRLRCGFTTGSCAALAAQAACELLFSGTAPERVAVTSPSGVRIEADVADSLSGADTASCAVRKDAGDDVDVTDGLLVYSQVRRCAGRDVLIDGGEGVGRVTLPGLEQPVGAAAINATPRAMIERAVREACARFGYGGGMEVTVSVPEGARVAAQTFNPHLGIEGGISILGTTGIVEPRSLAALRDSIELEIRQHAALGAESLVLIPGNYGESFVAEHFALADVPCVVCSNFVGAALDAACREGFSRVLLVGHVGKLVKVAAGVMDTHSRVADCRAETIAAHAALAGADVRLVRAVMEAVTTAAALDAVREAGLLAPVCATLAEALQDKLDRRVQGACAVAAVVFDAERAELFRTPRAEEVIEKMGVRYG